MVQAAGGANRRRTGRQRLSGASTCPERRDSSFWRNLPGFCRLYASGNPPVKHDGPATDLTDDQRNALAQLVFAAVMLGVGLWTGRVTRRAEQAVWDLDFEQGEGI